MIKLKVFIFIFLFHITLNLNCQYSNLFETKKSQKNRKIKLIDTKFISIIDSFINIIKEDDLMFRDKGYITVNLINGINQHIPNHYNVDKSLYISFSYNQYFISENFRKFPSYFTFLNNKLILFFEEKKIIDFTEKQKYFIKMKFIRLTNNYIERPKFILYKDSIGKYIKMQNIGRTGFGAGFYICYRKDDTLHPFIYKPLTY